ncbi:GNAT family N-acetyltransferase [Streptomyces yaizuensis]|uniref:Acetyltransferase n=1 Tax=Streptomyces yaizuensis TaxID=2989713 RepID=A0ABQ5PA67_9ACTN|nr:GNAT family N-acetyltransferase [Streptomyces sp. YSPA8]GLF99126.1 acetyltransferase [Streptomyces sp. YSPA8]
MPLELRHVTPDGLPDVRAAILEIHAEVRHRDFGMTREFHSVERFDERLSAYASRPGWAAVLGYEEGRPVGFCFGMTLAADTRWWSSMIPPVADDLVREDGRRTAALNEIVVRRPWRGRGVARRIHDTWLERRREERVTLLVDPAAGEGAVQAVYEGWGYAKVGEQQPFPDSPRFAALVRPVWEPSSM